MNIRLLCVFILLLAPLTLPAQSRRSSSPIPGIRPGLSADRVKAVKKHLEQVLDDRRDTQKKAVAEARKLRLKYQADLEASDADQLAAKAGFLYAYGGDWENADAVFQELSNSHPESLWNYEGQLCRFDIAAEHKLDLAAMEEISSALLTWARSVAPPEPNSGPPPAASSQPRPSSLMVLPIQYPGPPIVNKTEDGFEIEQRAGHSIAADVLYRAGLVSWLDGDLPQAKETFQQAVKLDPKLGNHIVPLGMAVTRGTPYRPSPVEFQKRENDIDKLILLADVYANSQEVYRTNQLWENILKQHKKDLSKPQRSYSEMKYGLSVFNLRSPLEKDSKKIIESYLDSQKTDPTAPWADRALFLAANVEWNLNRDYEAALALWKKQLDEYGDRFLAPQAGYRIGIVYEKLKKGKEAKEMYLFVLENYPDSGHEKLIEEHLRKLPRN